MTRYWTQYEKKKDLTLCTPLFKSNRNFCFNVKRWYLFSMYRFEIYFVAWWGLLHLLWKISWVYVIASRLCEHLNVVKFEKRAAKTPQHGHRYGNILILYDTINTYECFFCYNWHELCSSNKSLYFSIIYCFLVKYAIKYQTWMSSYPTPFMLICTERCSRTQEREPAHTG